jgi:hypothetical protein
MYYGKASSWSQPWVPRPATTASPVNHIGEVSLLKYICRGADVLSVTNAQVIFPQEDNFVRTSSGLPWRPRVIPL